MSAVITDNDSRPTSVADTLRRARALIEDPKHWVKGASARSSKRSEWALTPNDPEARAFCMLGALKRVDGPFERAAVETLAAAVGDSGFSENVCMFNDSPWRRHKEVLAAFDRAIAAAESGS